MHYEDVATAAKRWSPQISHPWPCVSPKCFDVLRHFALGSRPLTLPPLGSGGYGLTLKSAKSLKSSLPAAFLLAVNLDFAALTQQ